MNRADADLLEELKVMRDLIAEALELPANTQVREIAARARTAIFLLKAEEAAIRARLERAKAAA